MRKFIVLLVLSLLVSGCIPTSRTYKITYPDGRSETIEYFACVMESLVVSCYSIDYHRIVLQVRADKLELVQENYDD